MKKLITLIAGVLLAFGAMTVAPSPAAAHQYDANSYWSCGATRLNGSYFVGHSWPYYIDPGGAYVAYGCLDRWLDGTHEVYNGALLWWNREITGFDYRFCYLGESCPDPHQT